MAYVREQPEATPLDIENGRSGTFGSVIRGDRDRYVFAAAGGEYCSISVTSLEHNAVFQLYGPDGKIMSGAEEGEDATFWSDIIRTPGQYTIVVGTTRGNSTYNLRISLG